MDQGYVYILTNDRLVYFEAHPDMDAARQRERQLKGLNRAKKTSSSPL